MQDVLVALAAPAPAGLHFADARDAKRHAGRQRSAFKALTYMFAVAVQVAEKTSVPVAPAFGSVAGGRGGRGGARGKKKVRRGWMVVRDVRDSVRETHAAGTPTIASHPLPPLRAHTHAGRAAQQRAGRHRWSGDRRHPGPPGG